MDPFRPPQITADTLLRAYQWGLFPMGESREDPTIYWVDPEARGIIPLNRFHVPTKLRRIVRRRRFQVTVDRCFAEVVEACAAPQAGRPTTWINDRIIGLYKDLHDLGYAHSVECWANGELAGGLYGVSLGGAFFGESMFSRATDASKVGLVHLVARLRHGGYRLLDTQFVTEHLKRFGTEEIPRAVYLQRLAEALRHKGDFYSFDDSAAGDMVSAATGPSPSPSGSISSPRQSRTTTS